MVFDNPYYYIEDIEASRSQKREAIFFTKKVTFFGLTTCGGGNPCYLKHSPPEEGGGLLGNRAAQYRAIVTRNEAKLKIRRSRGGRTAAAPKVFLQWRV